MTYPTTLVENLALIAQADPASVGAGTVEGPDLMFGRDGTLDTPINQAFVVVQLGAAGTTLTVKLEQATTDAFSDAKIITGSDGVDKSIVMDDTDNRQAIINLKADELDAAGGFKYWRYNIVGVGTNLYGVLVFGGDSRYGPTSDYDLSSVTVIK